MTTCFHHNSCLPGRAVRPFCIVLVFLAAVDHLWAAESAEDIVKQGTALLGKEQLDEAVATFTKALAIDGRNVAALDGRGLAYDKKGEWEKAIADFDAVIRLDAARPPITSIAASPTFGRASTKRPSPTMTRLSA